MKVKCMVNKENSFTVKVLSLEYHNHPDIDGCMLMIYLFNYSLYIKIEP